MTVDEKSFYQYSAPAQPEKVAEHISAVREVTGIAEDEEIRKALDQTRDVGGEYNLPRAVDLLLGTPSPTTPMPPQPPAVVLSPPAQAITPQELKHKVVDLTEESKPEDDLQRAIALSLQDGGAAPAGTSAATSSQTVSGVSQEEQDVSKALEASLLETTRGRRKKEEQNPHDRQRDGEWPVGLKNVGQTCWFSAVIQSLFHLPVFRSLVLNFSPPEQEGGSEKERKNLEFMAELRKLFALLLSSRRKYVDPSRAVGILRGSLGGEGGVSTYDNNQQDVCEFTHKLLDWLEEAFKTRDVTKGDVAMKEDPAVKDNARAEEEPMEADLEKTDAEKESPTGPREEGREEEREEGREEGGGGKNPMYSLFYGQVRIEGRNQGAEFSRTEQFGQWPLQVNGYRELHESLEASTAHENFDSGVGAEERGGQERWFTSLPPILFLELSRFQFDRSRGVAEKINNVLEFPDVIYLDRYLESNKAVTRAKREQVRRLVERRTALQKELDGYTSYSGGAGGDTQFPLVSVLQLALDFAKSGGEGAECESQAMQVDSPCPSPRAVLTPASSLANLADPAPALLADGSVSIPIQREGEVAAGPSTDMEVEPSQTELPAQRQAGPVPRLVSELELKVLSACLARWGREVEEEIATLNANLQDIEARIKGMYEEESLRQRGYRLHAVMVHEGDAQQGHYWAYVHLPGPGRGWLKFNDNTVSQTTWAELSREAVGGRLSTSAYSCVYVDLARPELLSSAEQGDTMAEVRALPPDMDTFILEDNKSFAAEIVRWDEEQLLGKKEEGGEGGLEGTGQAVLIGDDPECQIIVQKPDLSQSHALLAKETTLETFSAMATSSLEKRKGEPQKTRTSAVINKIFQIVKLRVQQGKTEGLGERQDPRLESFLHYLVANELSVDMYRRALLEQVSLQEFEQQGEVGREVARAARDNIRSTADGKEDVGSEIGLWHNAYHQFRIAVNYFVLGVEKYTENLLEEALQLLTVSYVVNERIGEEPPTAHNPPCKMMKLRGLLKHFHLAVEGLNTALVEQFETGEEPGTVCEKVSRLLVPAIQILQARTHKQPGGRDAGILEEVRSRWCAMIDSSMSDRKRDYWGTIFNVVMGDDNSAVMKQPSNLRYPRMPDDLKLGARYRAAMQRLMRESEK